MASRWLLFLLLPLHLLASPGFSPPWGKDADLQYRQGSLPATPPPHSLAVRLAEKVIYFHQHVLSPTDGPRSHFRPSSSNYMKEAMQKHGFITGFLMGCDRLMRENSDPWVYRKIEDDGLLFKYNPVR